MFWIIVLLKHPPSFHVHHPDRGQQISISLIKNISVHFSIHLSFSYMECNSAIIKESCMVSVHTGHGSQVHYLLFPLKKLYVLQQYDLTGLFSFNHHEIFLV